MQRSCAELSAYETITAEQDWWGLIAQLSAEYETIVSASQHDCCGPVSLRPAASQRTKQTP